MGRLAGFGILAVLLSSIVTTDAFAQQDPPLEYGSAADLAGVHTVFIDTGTDMDDHDNIARIISRELPSIVVSARPQDAEVILVFRSSEATYYAGTYGSVQSNTDAEAHATGSASVAGSSSTSTTGYSAPAYQTISAGGGRVFRLTPEGGVRLILSFEGSKKKGTIWKKPRTKFAQKFIDTYRTANPNARK